MKMKIKQTFRSMWATILAVLMLLSTFSAVAVTLNKEATGETLTGGQIIYLNGGGSSLWNKANAWFAAYFYTGSNYEWVKMEQQTGDYYYATVPSGSWDNVIFVRKNPADTTLKTWTNKWNQTNDLTLSSSNNAYTISDSNEKSNGKWGTYQPSTTATLTASSTTVATGDSVTLTPGISDTTYNAYKSVSYSISPSTGASITDNTFTATTAGEYTVTATVTYNAIGYTGITKTAQASTTITVNSASPTSYTFHKKEKIYYDFTAYNGGYNYITVNGECTDQNNNYNPNTDKKIVCVELAKDFEVTADTVLFKTGPGDEKWEFRKISTLPTKGQNMIVCSSDGKTAHWSTYNDSSPVATDLSVLATPNPCYVNDTITLGHTETSVASGATFEYAYTTVARPSESDWFTIPNNANTFTPPSAETYYFRVTASKEGFTSVTSEAVSVAVSLKDVATNLTVTTDKNKCETHDTITLGHTQDSIEDSASFAYAYTTSASPTESNWITLEANTFTPTSAGTYYFRVTASKAGFADVTSENDCSVEVTLKDVVSNLTVSANKTKAHTNEAITLSYNTTDANPPSDMTVQYQYKKDTDETWTNTNSTFTPTEVGTYYYRVKLSKDTYNSVTSTNVVSTVVTDVVDVANVTLTPSNANPVNGDTVTYTATISDLASSATYTMTVDGTEVKSGTAKTGTVTYDYKFTDTSKHTVVITVTPADTYNYNEVSSTVEKTATSPKTFKINGRFRIKDESGNETKIGWKGYNKDDSDISFTYAGDGRYKLETGCTVKELSENIKQDGDAPQYFFIRNVTDSTTYYIDKNVETYLNETSKMAMKTASSDNDSSLFTDDDTSGKVTLWIDTSTSGSVYFWYTVPEAVKYSITMAGTTNGSFDTQINSVHVTEASAGATVTIKTNPDPGYGVANLSDITVTITGNSGSVGSGVTVVPTGNDNEYTFTMPEGSVTVNVTFRPIDYTMTGVANPNNIGGSVTPSVETANMGAKVTFTATPVDGYSVTGWTISGSDTYEVSGDNKSVEVTVGTADVTATANYEGNLFNVTQNTSSYGNYTVSGVTDSQAKCGDTLTITPSPATGYEFDSITVKKTDDATTTVPVNNNSFKMPAYNVTITVTFKVQEIKFAIVGILDNNNTYNTNYDSLDSKYKFSGIGSSIIVEKLSEFRLKNSSNKSFAQNISMTSGTTYDTTETTSVQFYDGGGNTWKITLVGVKSDGTPQVKVAKKSNYALYSGTKIDSTLTKEKIPVDFYDNGNGTYTAVGAFGIDNPKIFVHIEGGAFSPATNSKANNYYGGGSFSIGDETQYWKYNNDSDFESKTLNTNTYNKSTVYECTLTPNDNNIKLLIKSISKPLADGVTLTANPTTQTIGKKVTLTATLNSVNKEIPQEAEFTYTFYCGSDVLDTKTVTNKQSPVVATYTVSSNTAGTKSYTVTVSTKESNIQNYPPTDYESVTSNPVRVEYSDVVYYYAAVNPDTGDVNTRVAIPENNMVSTTVADGGTYYFSVFDNDTDTSPESVVDYTVDSANNRYCTISKSSTETGLDYLIVKCNAKCSNPVIYFDKANKTVYAVATQNVGSSKTLESKKTVTYYFAEEKYDSTDQSDPAAGGDGMRIKYWNNSVNNSTYTGYADVTTKVIRPGTDNNNNPEENNSIFVWVDKFPYPDGTTFPSTWNQNNRREFYIYSVDLPIWATSFSFVKSNGTALTINNTSQIPDQGTTTTASIVLNPNRVYCFLSFNYNNYVRGVVLDDSLWDGNARNTANSNEMATQGFASNIVNYDTKTNNDTFNKALTAQYGSDYQHPLYFKNWYYDDVDNDSKTLYDSSYFKLHDNLAMRYKEPDSYYASIQHLTDNRLSTDKKNEMGNGYLLGYNGTLMPLFDYDTLKTNPTLVYSDQLYENVQFPFYASTFNGVTTYSYDSTTDRNREVSTSGGKTTVNVSNNFVKKGKSYGYFPFGGTGTNDTYGCGTEFDINFYMTNNGKLSNGDDIAFNFSGDDDVWVYVDGVRVLDLGGAHSVSSGTINFSDMMVYYKTAANATDNVTKCKEKWSVEPEYVKTVSLKDLFEANGATFSNTDASTQHTLQMFYLERGEGESNCSISFNLPQNTGFRVNSNVTTDSVNEALVKDTMTAANKDYFNYQIANKLATETEYTNVSTTFANAPARAENVSGLTPLTTPNYPINSLLISREFLGTNYYLTATGATPSASDNGWLSSVNIDTFTTLKNVNYTLSDAYAVKGASDTETSPTGRVSESGIFNLLFGQSAIFESKIPNNTMIQLSQDDAIRKVNAGDGATTVITAGDASTRKVSDYYSSSYSIVDDNTGLEIGSGNKSAGVSGSFYADDASDNSNMFYFANYSGKTNTSSNAMTVTYTNDVLTSKIKLAKYVADPSATDNFYFKVEFSKIFGEDLATAKEYTDLQYTVYNSSDDKLVATRTYGKAGVYFTANQYAIIEGVPVDSAYNVVEKDRAGYKFESASKTTYTGNTAGTADSYDSNSVDGKTVSGADGTTTYDSITFTNSKQAFTVNFKYYDRSVITGTTSHISTSPTIVTYSYATLDGYTEEKEDKTRFKLEELITNAYAYYKFDNVIDTYQIFTSQTAAEDSDTGAGSLKVLREGLDGVTPGVTSYSTAYPSADLGLHYDCYGRPQGTADCKATDGEDWVTYYNGSSKLSQTDAAAYGASVTSITVWLYNTPKKYMPTFYYAHETDNGSDLAIIEGTTDRYVATTNRPFTISDNVYYNVRLGNANGNSQNDAATNYLKEYGINKGYCEEVPDINADVTYDNKSLKFLYWASDPRGKNIISTDIAYGYRVTNNLKAYAVYGVNDFNAKGLTITPNTPDYYSNSNGKALVRLNNVMNVYNCPERDTNIKNASIIYIIDYSKADGDGKTQMDKLIEAGGFDELQAKVREVLKANENSKNFLDSENIVIDVTKVTFEKAEYGDIDITGFNHKVVPYNEALNPGTDDIKLTNKNRVQFTTSFTKSNLAKLKMYAMLGMDYGAVVSGKNDDTNSWIVSDNLLYYAFDANGNVSSIKDPILKHEFYNSTTAS